MLCVVLQVASCAPNRKRAVPAPTPLPTRTQPTRRSNRRHVQHNHNNDNQDNGPQAQEQQDGDGNHNGDGVANDVENGPEGNGGGNEGEGADVVVQHDGQPQGNGAGTVEKQQAAAPVITGDVEGYVTLTEEQKARMRKLQREAFSRSADGIDFVAGLCTFIYVPTDKRDEDTLILKVGEKVEDGAASREAAEAFGIACVVSKGAYKRYDRMQGHASLASICLPLSRPLPMPS